MDDLRLAYLRDQVRVVRVRERTVEGVREFVLTVDHGAREASRVTVNGFDADFSVQDSVTVVADAPRQVLATSLSSLDFEVHSTVFTGGYAVRLDLEVGIYSTAVSGIQKLVQEVLLDLLSTPGSDAFDLDRGGGILGKLGMLTSGPRAAGDIVGAILLGVRSTAESIKRRQRSAVGSGTIPSEERLASLEIGTANVQVEADSLSVTIRVVNEAGQSAMIPLVA